MIHVALTAARGVPRALKFDKIIFLIKNIFVLKIRKNTVFHAQGALSLYTVHVSCSARVRRVRLPILSVRLSYCLSAPGHHPKTFGFDVAEGRI